MNHERHGTWEHYRSVTLSLSHKCGEILDNHCQQSTRSKNDEQVIERYRRNPGIGSIQNPRNKMASTMKQMWRKASTPIFRGADSKEMDGDQRDNMGIARDSTPSSSLAPGKVIKGVPKKLRSALNLYAMMTEAEKADNPKPKDTRTMRFSSTVHICLIPSRDELKQQRDELFWKPEDYATFKHDAVHELRVFLTANGITAKEAIFQLYQPHDHEREQWMQEFDELELERERERERGDKDCETDRESSSTPNGEDETDRYCSEEDDEPLYGRGDNEALNKFLNLKTDIELNAESSIGSDHKRSSRMLPTKTPNAGVSQGQVWAVQWKPKHTAEHK